MYPRWISRIGAPLIALVLIVAPSVPTVHAVEDTRKVSVVSFGLFGDQGVFRSEATGAARVVASRFGGAPINVQYNSKKGGGATIEGLADLKITSSKSTNGPTPEVAPSDEPPLSCRTILGSQNIYCTKPLSR